MVEENNRNVENDKIEEEEERSGLVAQFLLSFDGGLFLLRQSSTGVWRSIRLACLEQCFNW